MIRFRAWDINDKEMVDVDTINWNDGKLDFIGDGITEFRKYNDIKLMQSTMLVDENCKEVFEGDILSVETDEENVKVSVFWDNKHALFMVESKKYNEKSAFAELVEDNAYPFKIIGNIYENPELLEV